ncbi:MAG: hypothetical protein ACLFTK_03935 [Anaerolineales bacterium]
MAAIQFVEKWHAAQSENNSRLALGIAPHLADLPAPIARHDDPFLPFARAIIEATADMVALYVFDLASFLALGAAGARALERSIPLVPAPIPTVLDGPFWTAGYARAAYADAFAVDAVTLATNDTRAVNAYVKSSANAAFVHRMTGTPPSGHNIGLYDDSSFYFDATRLLWVTEDIIYASALDSFQADIRAAAERFRDESLA